MNRILAAIAALGAAFTLSADVVSLGVSGAGGTNTLDDTINLQQASAIAIQVGFTGRPERKTAAVFSVANAPAFGDTVTLALNGTTTVYSWTNAPTTNITVLIASAPVLRVAVTNVPTNGQTLTVTWNAHTNTYIWTNAAAPSPFVLTNNTTAKCATNLLAVLADDFQKIRGVATYSATGIELNGNVGDYFTITNSDGWATTVNSSVYTVTNTVATNAPEVLIGGTANASATNLFNKLHSDFNDLQLLVAQTGAAQVTMTTPFGESFTVSENSSATSVTLTTNAITGGIKLIASESLDKRTWFRKPTLDIPIDFSNTAAVNYFTNFTSLDGVGYLKYQLENDLTNHANASGIQFQYLVKKPTAGF